MKDSYNINNTNLGLAVIYKIYAVRTSGLKLVKRKDSFGTQTNTYAQSCRLTLEGTLDETKALHRQKCDSNRHFSDYSETACDIMQYCETAGDTVR